MNADNSENSELDRFMVNLADQINLETFDRYISFSKLSIEKHYKILQKQ